MNSEKTKKLIIICLLIVIIFGTILLFVMINNKENEKNNNEVLNEVIDERYNVDRSKAQSIDKKYIKEANEYNYLEIKATTHERIINEYLEHYKEEALNYIEDAYESLDENFKKEKFGSLENYKEYVDNNRSDLENIKLDRYKVNEYKNYTEYICIDQNNNYYIFNVTRPGKYTVCLDTYTVNLPQFAEEYAKSDDKEKVALNINKVITALNLQDYKYIYSKLADSFKDNYFPNEDALKEHLVNNLYENNMVEFMEFSPEGTVYTYKVKIKKIIPEEEKERYYGKNAPMKYVNIVMQLEENDDFIMSFNIE